MSESVKTALHGQACQPQSLLDWACLADRFHRVPSVRTRM
jgi:hypothetical protein